MSSPSFRSLGANDQDRLPLLALPATRERPRRRKRDDEESYEGERTPQRARRLFRRIHTFPGFGESVVNDVLGWLREPQQKAPFCHKCEWITLVDGQNLLTNCSFDKDGKRRGAFNQGVKEVLLPKAKAALGEDTSQVLIIWPMTRWTEVIEGNGNCIREMVEGFEPLRARGTSLLFLLINGFSELERSQNKKRCKMDNMQTFEHLACEFDDVLFTYLYNALVQTGLKVNPLSADKNVHKSDGELARFDRFFKAAGYSVQVELAEIA